MERVIIYDKDEEFVNLLSTRLNDDIACVIIEHYTDMEELRGALMKNVDQYIFAIVDIDSEEDKCDGVLNLISGQYIPQLVLTSSANMGLRDSMIKKYPLIDFATKDSSKNFHYISSIINHMQNSQNIEVLLISNSQYDRNYIYDNLLIRYPFDIVDAKDKDGVASALEKHPHIKIIIIDYMPEEEGLEIVEEIREFEQKDSLAIMAVTSRENTYLAARYLQAGANDFVIKPIEVETFNSRMNVMIETLSLFEKLQKLANVDYLTSLYNRRYFFEAGNMLFANAKRKNISIVTAMMDIDHFKSVNDTYGHNVGDIVLKEVSRTIKKTVRSSDLVARLGGEEFSVVLVGAKEELTFEIFEKLRKSVESLEIDTGEEKIKVTISIGISFDLSMSLEDMLNKADDALYDAKQSGRNKVVIVK